jgi:hypothetical protein
MGISGVARLRSRMSEKLGRCPRCIRSAMLGMVATWLLTAAVYVWGNGVALALAGMLAAAFSLLFAGHIGAMVAREIGARRAFRRVRSDVPLASSPDRRRFFGASLRMLTAAAAVLAVDFGAATRVAAAQVGRILRLYVPLVPCNCYYTDNCKKTGRGNKCKYVWTGVSCQIVKKPDMKINGVFVCGEPPNIPQCDGLCMFKLARRLVWEEVQPFDVVQAAELYFQAYLQVGRRAGGPPDREIVRRAADIPLPVNWHLELIDAVHGALDATLGWDFMKCTVRPTCFGNVGQLTDVAAELVDAAREGFIAGLRDNNPDAVEAPLRDFWSRNEGFSPMHHGRCYAHGHPNAPDELTCQIDDLKGDLMLLLAGRTPARA